MQVVNIYELLLFYMGPDLMADSIYRQISNMSRTKNQNLNVSRLGL